MVEVVAAFLGLLSASIFLAHALEAYSASYSQQHGEAQTPAAFLPARSAESWACRGPRKSRLARCANPAFAVF